MTAGNGPVPSGLARKPCMRSPRVSGLEAPSNSTRSRDAAKASANSKLAIHQNTMVTAAGEVTALRNGASPEWSPTNISAMGPEGLYPLLAHRYILHLDP